MFTVHFIDYKDVDVDMFLQNISDSIMLTQVQDTDNVESLLYEWQDAPIKEARVKDRYRPLITFVITKLTYKRDYLKAKSDRNDKIQ